MLDSADSSGSIRFIHPLSIVSKAQAVRVCRAFGQAISEITKNPSLAINEISLSSADDLALLMEWNQPPPVAKEYTIPQLIYHQAVARPNVVAINAWDGSITYGDLDWLSNRLALYLRIQGLKHDEFVPLLFEKSKGTTLAMLGVMKAGAAFVLFDPALPVQRLRDMATQVNARVVLCSESLESKARELGQEVIPVTDGPSVWCRPRFSAGMDDYHWQQDVKPDYAAYAAFTSGSTGKPKCSVISHRSYTTAALAQIEPLGLTTSTRILQFCSYSFDVSILETLMPLIAGACVCVPPTEESRSNLASVICQFDVNFCVSTPSVYRTLDHMQVPSLQTIFIGGEPVTETDILQWTGTHIKMVIGYGPCECTPTTAIHTVQNSRDRHVIGTGVGAALWITNPEDPSRLQPIGAPGELLIEGPLVGRGYLNDPIKTQAAFIEPPSWLTAIRGKTVTNRLYRTGDLVHYTADGLVKYIGRKDSQVKLNGQRLELEEVQHKLKELLGDTASDVLADVITPSDPGSNPTLIGFIRFQDAKESPPSDPNSLFVPPSEECLELSKAIITKSLHFLPRYMVPSVIIPLSSVPFTATDKVNRKELRRQASALSRQQLASYISSRVDMLVPRTVQEKLIYQLTKDALRLETFGIDDNFFHLGGDSLAAMRLVTLARKSGLQLKITDVFNQPRLADLASYVSVRSKQPVRTNAIVPFSLLSGPVQQKDIVYEAWRKHSIPFEEIEDIYPCTQMQTGMMALSTTNPGTYIIHSTFHLPVDLDLDRFKKAWEEVAKQNPVLRTRFIQIGSEMFQLVVRENITWGDKGSIQDDGVQGPFGFGEPSMRLAIDEPKRVFYFSLHHSVYDGWSLPLILKQVNAAYFGQALEPRPFAPYIHYLLQTDTTAVEHFWREQMKGYKATVFPSASANYQGEDSQETSLRSIPLNKTTGLQGTTTLATAIRLAWALTIANYTGSTDVMLGLVGSGRNIPLDEIEQVTGPTITSTPCRVLMDLSQTVEEHLVRIQTQAAAAIPFEHIGLQSLAKLGGECTAAAMVRNLLVVQPEHDAIPRIFGQVAPNGFDVGISSFGFVLECDLGSEVLNIRAHYNTNVLHKNETDSILDLFSCLLTEVRSKPQARLSELSTISARDLARVKSWNASVPEPVDSCIQDLIRQHVDAQPKAPAVEAWDGSLSYDELDRASSVTAAQLSTLVSPETFVPVYSQKSKWVIVAILGVLKSGAAFVLLDSSYPPNRIKTICRQVQASVVLTMTEHEGRLHDWTGLNVVVADKSDAIIPLPDVYQYSRPSHAAYAAFTSGSTGTPKGTIIEHRNFVTNTIHGYHNSQTLDQRSRVLQFASYVFDASIAEILFTLTNGGCVCVPREEDRVINIVEYINQFAVNLVFQTPSVARTLLPNQIPNVTTMILCGESMKQTDVSMWAGRVRLMNAYGPSECSVDSMKQLHVKKDTNPSNIGACISAASWIVSPEDHEKLLPVGAVGELLIEGPIVGRGYLNEPEKTAEVFIDPPQWLRSIRGGQYHSRLYKTGDLVQYDPRMDGTLLFVDRKDTQVKLRGQRIELGEIETQILHAIPGLNDVFVELVTVEKKPPALFAFLWGGKDDSNIKRSSDGLFYRSCHYFQLLVETIQVSLAAQLPAHMVPSEYFPLRFIPRSSTGKIDRKRLRETAAATAAAALMSSKETKSFCKEAPHMSQREPRTDAEIIVQQAVAAVLQQQIADVELESDFFQMGGTSLTAMSLVSTLRTLGSNSLRVTDIYNQPVLCQLAELMTLK